MRIGMAGLNALYWPVTTGNYLLNKPGVEFLAAAMLGESDAVIKDSLGQSPADYAARYNVRLYDRAEEMIEREKLDTVILISRHSQHADWVDRLAPLGVNIFIPKTFVTSGEEADRIITAEKQYGIRVAVGPTARYLPPMQALIAALNQGLIGQPFSVRICHHHGTIDVFHANDWYRDPLEGGPELSLGWYGIDLAMQLTGDPVKSVFASYGNYTSPESPFMDCGRMLMEMQHGGIASFDMYFCNRLPYPSWQVEIIGPKGVLSLHRVEGNPSQTIVNLDTPEGCRILPIPQHTPHWEMFWVDELLQGRNLSVTAEYARQVTLISLAARESAKSGKRIPLQLLPVVDN